MVCKMDSHMTRLTCFILLLFVAVGCENEKKSTTAPATTAPMASDHEAAKLQRDTNMASADSSMIKISGLESASHQLPPVQIAINPGDHGFSVARFAGKDKYLSLSGPPGGPLNLQVERLQKVPVDDAGWRKLVEQRFAERKPIEMGSAAELEIAGGKNQAFTCSTGESLACAHHLLIVVPISKSHDGILVDFEYAAANSKTPAPLAVIKDSGFGDLLRSLSIRFE